MPAALDKGLRVPLFRPTELPCSKYNISSRFISSSLRECWSSSFSIRKRSCRAEEVGDASPSPPSAKVYDLLTVINWAILSAYGHGECGEAFEAIILISPSKVKRTLFGASPSASSLSREGYPEYYRPSLTHERPAGNDSCFHGVRKQH